MPNIKRSGKDKPKWDADMDSWDDLTVRKNPRYISPNTLLGYSENINVKSLAISGEIK